MKCKKILRQGLTGGNGDITVVDTDTAMARKFTMGMATGKIYYEYEKFTMDIGIGILLHAWLTTDKIMIQTIISVAHTRL